MKRAFVILVFTSLAGAGIAHAYIGPWLSACSGGHSPLTSLSLTSGCSGQSPVVAGANQSVVFLLETDIDPATSQYLYTGMLTAALSSSQASCTPKSFSQPFVAGEPSAVSSGTYALSAGCTYTFAVHSSGIGTYRGYVVDSANAP